MYNFFFRIISLSLFVVPLLIAGLQTKYAFTIKVAEQVCQEMDAGTRREKWEIVRPAAQHYYYHSDRLRIPSHCSIVLRNGILGTRECI